MVFSSNLFLFLFLPLVLGAYYVAPRTVRNGILLLASLLFYAWGAPTALPLLLLSIGLNYALGRWVEQVRDRRAGPWVVAAAVVLNLAPLAYFKYAGFFCETLSSLLQACGFAALARPNITLPIGISFFTFQALSYVLDVYRRDTAAARNPVEVALYVAFFPQLIAGPIVRYRDVADQLASRRETTAGFAAGIERFVVGLGKKVLLANSVGAVADQIFSAAPAELTADVAWLGIVCYTLQIYYDFSGYSDMAIGLGLMFGIRFLENFNYPYAAASVTEFWRRWHISLSIWFRDYLYIPLGGNRSGLSRTYRNLLIVFLLCGLWHGAGWTFVLWGLFHGAFLVLERGGLGRLLERAPRPVAVGYTLLVVMIGWVFFRADDLAYALGYLKTMAGLSTSNGVEFPLALYLDPMMAVLLAAAAVGATPWLPAVRRAANRWTTQLDAQPGAAWEAVSGVGRIAALGGILAVVAVFLSAATYNPFIYFRF